MSVSALDSRIFRDLFGTQKMRDVFSDEAYVQKMIDVEIALARAQSETGVIPAGTGDALNTALKDVEIE
jgi:3-carboxy-cis,cis-muconate cycloisomerase